MKSVFYAYLLILLITICVSTAFKSNIFRILHNKRTIQRLDTSIHAKSFVNSINSDKILSVMSNINSISKDFTRNIKPLIKTIKKNELFQKIMKNKQNIIKQNTNIPLINEFLSILSLISTFSVKFFNNPLKYITNILTISFHSFSNGIIHLFQTIVTDYMSLPLPIHIFCIINYIIFILWNIPYFNNFMKNHFTLSIQNIQLKRYYTIITSILSHKSFNHLMNE